MNVLLNVLKWSAAVGAVTLAVSALRPLLDRRFSPRWRYWLWLVLAAALLLAPARWEALIPALPEPAVTVEAGVHRHGGGAELHCPQIHPRRACGLRRQRLHGFRLCVRHDPGEACERDGTHLCGRGGLEQDRGARRGGGTLTAEECLAAI